MLVEIRGPRRGLKRLVLTTSALCRCELGGTPENMSAAVASTARAARYRLLPGLRVRPAFTPRLFQGLAKGFADWISPIADPGAETGNQFPRAPGDPSDDSSRDRFVSGRSRCRPYSQSPR